MKFNIFEHSGEDVPLKEYTSHESLPGRRVKTRSVVDLITRKRSNVRHTSVICNEYTKTFVDSSNVYSLLLIFVFIITHASRAR